MLLRDFPTTVPGYRIEIAEEDRLSEIFDFLRRNYHDEETMSKSLQLNRVIEVDESELVKQDEDDLITATFKNSPCLIAIHNESNKIVGINMTILSRRPEINRNGCSGSAGFFATMTFRSEGMKEYFKYMSKMDKDVDMFQRYPNARAILEFFIIAVDEKHRRKGLAKDLSTNGITLAKSMPEVDAIFGVYTSLYSKKVAVDIGMKNVLDIDLLTIKNENGDLVFPNSEPHNIVSVMVLEL